MVRKVRIVAIMIYTITALLLFLLIWSSFATINVMIRVQGKVEPFSQIQVIEHLEGGILEKLYVQEGEKVKEGEVLAKLKRHAFSTKHSKAQAQRAVLIAEVARLKAEANGMKEIPFPPGFERSYPAITAQTRKLFKKNKQALKSELETLRHTHRLTKQELNIIKPLVDKQVLSKVEELRLQRKLNEIEGKIQTRKHEFRAEAHRQLTQKQAELTKARHTHKLTKRKLEELKLKAPTNGIVKKVHVTAKGSVIQPGEKVVEIVPVDRHPIITAQVRSKDLGYIKEGLKAKVTFSAQSMTQYGTVPAKLVYISPDSEKGDDGNYYYQIKLESLQNKFRAKSGEMIPIKPGMSVTVAIKVGERSILGSLLTPLFRTMESALEGP